MLRSVTTMLWAIVFGHLYNISHLLSRQQQSMILTSFFQSSTEIPEHDNGEDKGY